VEINVGKRNKRREKIKGKRKRKNKEIKRKVKGIMVFSLSYSSYTARRSCFAKRFSKRVSTSAENPLHKHSHSQNCHSRVKRILNITRIHVLTCH
jgi:hypothetical protein